MHDEIWYREELMCLRDLVNAAIVGPNVLDRLAMAALDHLQRKLEAAIAAAPSGAIPAGAA